MRVLVLGASGFLGRWVARALVQERHRVRLLVRSPKRLGTLSKLGLEVKLGDVLDKPSLARAMRGVDVVVNCAACVSLNPRDKATIYEVNVTGTKNVIEAAGARELRTLHTSSIGAVGPAREPIVLDETAPRLELDFEYPYADSKRDSEDLALAYAAAGHDVVVLNPGIMLGPDDQYYTSTEFVMRYLRSELGVHLPGGGSFCDVRDVAAAYVKAIDRGRRGERYILAGVNREYGQVMEELRLLTGLQRSMTVPPLVAEWTGLLSEWGAAVWQHPLRNFNLSVARWGSLFNYCAVDKAKKQLGYRNRNFRLTLTDTVIDLLGRGAARPSTPKLRALLARAGRADPRTAAGSGKRSNTRHDRERTQRTSPNKKRLSRDSGR